MKKEITKVFDAKTVQLIIDGKEVNISGEIRLQIDSAIVNGISENPSNAKISLIITKWPNNL